MNTISISEQIVAIEITIGDYKTKLARVGRNSKIRRPYELHIAKLEAAKSTLEKTNGERLVMVPCGEERVQ